MSRANTANYNYVKLFYYWIVSKAVNEIILSVYFIHIVFDKTV